MAEQSKGQKIGFWVATAAVGGIMVVSGAADIANPPEVAEIFARLGYPDYFPRYLGVAKFLGGVALLAPGFPRLKEWAYAGVAFDLISALYSHIATGDDFSEFAPVPVFLIALAASYFLRPESRRLPDAPQA